MYSHSKSYHVVSKLIHWITALLIFGLLAVGFYMGSLDFSEDKLALYALHKSFGLLVLTLVTIRVIWHIIHRKPKSLSTHTKIEKALSHAAHAFLYLAMFALPLSGWVMSSAGDFSIQFFGIDMPDIVSKDEALFRSSREVHEILAIIITGVIGLHILGALKHHFIDRDETLQRMTFKRLGLLGGVGLTILVGVFFSPAVFYTANEILKEFSEEHRPSLSAPEHQESQEQPSADTSSSLQTEDTHGEWDIISEQSYIKFSATQYGQTFEGQFHDFDGIINFDPENLDAAFVKILIDIGTIKTGSDDRDSQAVLSDWFDVNAFPKAEFVADNFEIDANGDYVAVSSLTIRGVSSEIALPFSLIIDGDKAEMNAKISLNRLDFGIGQGQWQSTDAIGGNVDVSIKVEAQHR